MNNQPNRPSDLFFDQLRDIHSVESQVAGTLPHLSKLATFPELRKLLLEQHEMSLEQKRRVAGIFETHARDIGSDESQGMKGLINGGNEHLARADDTTVRDLMLVAHCSRIKHYEIAAYQFATTLALHLGYTPETEILSPFLEKERNASDDLDAVAEAIYAAGGEEF